MSDEKRMMLGEVSEQELREWELGKCLGRRINRLREDADFATPAERRARAHALTLEVLGRHGFGLTEREPRALSPFGLLNQLTRWFGRRVVFRYRWTKTGWVPFDRQWKTVLRRLAPRYERGPHPDLIDHLDEVPVPAKERRSERDSRRRRSVFQTPGMDPTEID